MECHSPTATSQASGTVSTCISPTSFDNYMFHIIGFLLTTKDIIMLSCFAELYQTSDFARRKSEVEVFNKVGSQIFR